MSSNGTSGRLPGALKIDGKLAGAGALLAVLLVVGFGVAHAGCVNLHTPPGHEGYLRSQPYFGEARFVGIQRGPTSTGLVWRQQVVNIDTRPRTFSEDMVIRTRQGSELKFRAHAVVGLKQDSVKEVVERFGGTAWYEQNVQKQFQSEVRAKVQSLEPFEVKNQSVEIADEVLAIMQKRYEDSPVDFLSINIGDIEYPRTIVDSVTRKFVTFQENERKDIEKMIAEAQIAIGIAEARGRSMAQRIVRTTLDPMFLQYEALRAIEQLSGSQNTTFVVTPYSANGTSPIIMSLDK